MKPAASASFVVRLLFALAAGIAAASRPEPAAAAAPDRNEVAKALAACQDEDKLAEMRARACTFIAAMHEIEPEIRAEALLNRAILRQGEHDIDAAIADLAAAIALNPNYPAIYAQRAEAYEQKGQLELALADRTKVIELEPSAEGYTARAIVYGGLGQGRNAEADYRAALALEPDHEEAKAGLESLGEP